MPAFNNEKIFYKSGTKKSKIRNIIEDCFPKGDKIVIDGLVDVL